MERGKTRHQKYGRKRAGLINRLKKTKKIALADSRWRRCGSCRRAHSSRLPMLKMNAAAFGRACCRLREGAGSKRIVQQAAHSKHAISAEDNLLSRHCQCSSGDSATPDCKLVFESQRMGGIAVQHVWLVSVLVLHHLRQLLRTRLVRKNVRKRERLPVFRSSASKQLHGCVLHEA